MTDRPRIDLITVCYRTELALLRLQARSMDRFLDPEGLGRILVVINDEDEAACEAAFEAIRPDWGRHAARVEIIRGTALMTHRFRGPRDRLERLWVAGPRCAWRHWRDRLLGRPRVVYAWGLNSGWLMQQALKLYAARRVSADYAVILDAKNFFVAPTGTDLFVAPCGRARVTLVTPPPKLLAWVGASARALGRRLADCPTMPESSTPVVLPAARYKAAVDEIEAKLGPLECFFARRSAKATEFMLLYAALGGGDAAWQSSFAPVPRRWIRRLDASAPGELVAEMAQAETWPEPLLALHRKRLFRTGAADRAVFAEYLAARGLLRDPGELEVLLAG